MEPLPMARASCSLDEDGLETQLERYRAAGDGAQIIARESHRLAIRVSDRIPAVAIHELVAVERSCCPFFELDWEPEARYLAVAIARQEHEPALRAIAAALGLGD